MESSSSISTQPSCWLTTRNFSLLAIWVQILDSVLGSDRTLTPSVLAMAMSFATCMALSSACWPVSMYSDFT